MVGGRLAAALFFQGLGLGAGVGDGRQQPAPVQGVAVVFGELHLGTGTEIRAVALPGGGAGVVAQGLKSGFGEGLATGVGLETAGVVVVLVVLAMMQSAGGILVHQGVGRIPEGVVLHGHGGHPHPLLVSEAIHHRAPGAASRVGVVLCRGEFRRIAVVIGDDQGRLNLPVHAAVFVAVVPAFLGGQAFEEGQVTFPVLHTVFPLLRWAFEIEHRIDNAPFLQQGPHDGIGALGLENPAVVHQAQTPERRLDDQFVAGAPVAGTAPGEFADHAGKPSKRHAVLPDGEIDRLFQNVRSLNQRVGTSQLKTTVKHLGKALGQGKANH